jgi:CoA:oxalate CoA-transferase
VIDPDVSRADDEEMALTGTTVVDLSQGIAGPYCAAVLAEMGARTVKIEPPEGDWSRRAGGAIGASSAIFETFNRGKDGIVLDLRSATGQQTVRKLVEQADVVIENARVGAMSRFGLGYEQLREINPALIYVSVTGYGQSGPYARRPATDTVIQGFSGLALSSTDGQRPERLRVAVIDVVTGLYASQSVMAALMVRSRTGKGRHIDISLAHAAAALQTYKISDALVNGLPDASEVYAVTGNYLTRNGWICMSAASEAHELAALRALGCQTVVQQAEFSSTSARCRNQTSLRKHVAGSLATMTTEESLGLLEAAQVPCQQVLNYCQFAEDAQVKSMSLFRWIQTADGARMPAMQLPGFQLNSSPKRAPGLGEHAAQVSRTFGLAQ